MSGETDGRGRESAAAESYPEHLRELVEEYLATLDFSVAPPAAALVDAMRYSLLAGGKRIRPVLALAVAESLDHDPHQVLPYAAALELIHTYSLIHDDLPAIDDDDLRRGKPTCHVAYGEDIAILAGDGLFAEAFRLIVESQKAPAEVVVAALREVTGATGVQGMVGGQYMDVAAVVGHDDELRLLHALKTGRLIEAAVAGAALLCGVGTQARGRSGTGPGVVAIDSAPAHAADGLRPYREFAREVGLLFQIVDDILDVAGDQALIGKTSGKDARQDKVTYVSRYGLERARELADASHARAIALLGGLRGGGGSLRAVADYIRTREL